MPGRVELGPIGARPPSDAYAACRHSIVGFAPTPYSMHPEPFVASLLRAGSAIIAFAEVTLSEAKGQADPDPPMKKLCIAIAFLASSLGAQDVARWEKQAANVTITRDDWGIAHVRGRTDADAVFGMIYAQAEDDFNRIETNYLVSLGRLSEAEGEEALWKDLRQRLFVDPDTLQVQ